MATVFEVRPAGADEAAVVADAALYDTVNGTVVYDRDPAISFQSIVASIRFANPAGTAASSLEQLFTSTNTRYTTRVMRTTAITAGTFVTLSRWRLAAAATTVEVRRLAGGELVLRLDGVSVATSAALSFTANFRYEVDLAGTTANFRVYSTATSTVPSQSFGPFTWTGSNFDRIADGVGNAAAATTAHLLYAVDGDTSNPSIDRYALAAPTGVTATAASATSITVSWSLVSVATGYDVERNATVVASGLTAPPFTDTGLAGGSEYTYRVRATK